MALASTSGQSCGYGCTITGQAPADSYFEFQGDAGNDWVAICDQFSPSTTDCVDPDTASWAAYGGSGADWVGGSPYADTLDGGDDTSDLVAGYAGDDDVWDEDGGGALWGGAGCDALHAVDGGTCYCDGNGGTQTGCTTTDGECSGCY